MVARTDWQSPEKENNPIQVSCSTIDRGSYSGVLEKTQLSNGQRGMARKLRHHGKTRHKQGEQETPGKIRISNPIELRPEEANNRGVIGHWECDTVDGKTESSHLITLTDWHSRYLLAKKLCLCRKWNDWIASIHSISIRAFRYAPLQKSVLAS